MRIKFASLLLLLLAPRQLFAGTAGAVDAERYWIAGRYDATHFIVYFSTVRFGGRYPADARDLPGPAPRGFFTPVEISAADVPRLQQRASVEPIRLGDHYDLLVDDGQVLPLELTLLVGCMTDEGSGNDSYLGAIGSIDAASAAGLTHDYYVVTRHHATAPSSFRPSAAGQSVARLLTAPSGAAVANEILDLLRQWLAQQPIAGNMPPHNPATLTIDRLQAFTTPSGQLRYFATTQPARVDGNECEAISAWLDPDPAMHIVKAVGQFICFWQLGRFQILNVVDLGGGKAGVVMSFEGGASVGLQLLEYQDSSDVGDMRVLQVIAAGD